MTLEENEYIILNPDFLFLLVESDSYNFNFSGYPKGELQDNGLTYYSDSLTLEGDLILKEGVVEPSHLVDVTLGYQTCNKEGVCNMPVEITRELAVGTPKKDVPWVYILIVILSVTYFTLRSKYKPKDNGKK